MDDQQRPPRESDRKQVRDRIERAMASGRIGAADGAIRLTNVSSAQSMAELGMMTRDLDQLEATLAPAGPVPQAMPPRVPPSAAALFGAGGRRTLPALVIGLVVALVVAGAVAVLAFASVGGSAEETAGPPLPAVVGSSAAGPVTGASPVGDPTPAASTYALTVPGIKAFLAAYRARFSTTKVVDLTLYGDYVVVQVPVPGRSRHSGWVYRRGEFSDFGGVTANFPGSAAVDTRELDVAALVRNFARAQRLLKVEDVSTRYVSIDYRPQFDDEPNVNLYLSNPFHESGYLATTLDGRVERAYPYDG